MRKVLCYLTVANGQLDT